MNKCLKKIFIVAFAVCCVLSVQLSVSAEPVIGNLGDVQDWINDLFPSTTQNNDNTTPTVVSRKTGDVNDDGRITAADARHVLRASAGLDWLSVSDFYAADVNHDGVITAKDARSVLRYAAGISSSF